MKDLVFPILLLKPGEFFVYRSRRDIEKTTEAIVGSGWFKGWHLVDYESACFLIEDCVVVGSAGLIGTWHPKYAGKMVKIDFELQEAQLDLAQLKEAVLADIDKNQQSYEDIVGVDFDDLKNEIRNASSSREIIDLM